MSSSSQPNYQDVVERSLKQILPSTQTFISSITKASRMLCQLKEVQAPCLASEQMRYLQESIYLLFRVSSLRLFNNQV